MISDKQFTKNFIWNIIGTTLNAFNSLFFMIIVTRVNGLEDAGIFSIGFATACILYVAGVYSGRIFQVTDTTDVKDKEFVLNRVITSVVMILLVVGFLLIKGYTYYKAIVFILLCIYKAVEAFSDVLYGIFQKNDLLYKVGISYTLKSLISLLIFAVVDILTKNIIISILSMVISYIVITIVYDVLNVNKLYDRKIKTNTKNIFKIFKSGFFTFAIAFLGLYLLNAPKYAIDNFLSEDIQAIFGMIIMPATVMGLIAQFVIHPYLNTFLEYCKSKKFKELKKLMYRIIIFIFGVGVFCSIVAYLIGTPVLGFIYSVDLSPYSLHLLFILIAATFYTAAGIISPILITMRYTFIQFVIYAITSVLTLVLCNVLVNKYNIEGAVGAYFITMLCYFILFYFVSIRIINKQKQLIDNEEK